MNKNNLLAFDNTDIYSIILFIIFKIKKLPEYAALSELVYVLDKDSLLKLCEYFGGTTIKIPTIEIRQMKTRWGSCIPACNKVIFNLNLIKTPICCIEYVVLHELSHFKHQNHSKNFYNFITIKSVSYKQTY